MGVVTIPKFYNDFTDEEIMEAIAECEFLLQDTSDYYNKKERPTEDVNYFRLLMTDRFVNRFGYTKLAKKYESTYWRVSSICREGEEELADLLKEKRENGFTKIKAAPKPKKKPKPVAKPVRLNEFFWRNLKRTSIRLTQTIFPKESDVAIKFDKEITSKELRLDGAIATYGLRIMRDKSPSKHTYLIFNAFEFDGLVQCVVTSPNKILTRDIVITPENCLAFKSYTNYEINYPTNDEVI